MISERTGRERQRRGECQVGDWVAADRVAEWTLDGSPRGYRPQSVVISPEAGAIGGIVPAPRPDHWTFMPSVETCGPAWRRER